MQRFEEVLAIAAERKGGIAVLERELADTKSLDPAQIAAMSDDRILVAMTRRVFSAGFSSKVIDAKWDAFESAFHNFDPARCAWMTEEYFDELLKNTNIVRNGAKIRSVQANARFVLELAQEHGSAARFFAGWPDTDYISLLDILKKRGSHLGGDSGMRFLRAIGKPAFIPTPDVVAALIRAEVLTKSPSSKADFAAMQKAFNQWSMESGKDLTAISRILAMSVGDTSGGHARTRIQRRRAS
jgi:3-methyladenine DNA glycosylase Tag